MTRLQSKKNWAETLAAFEDYLHRKGRAQNSISAYRATLKDFGKFYQNELKKSVPMFQDFRKQIFILLH